MPAHRSIRTAVALASFAATLAAAWLVSRNSVAAPSGMLDRIAGNAAGRDRTAAGPSLPDKSPAAVTAAFEHALTTILNPASEGVYSGERLDELCTGAFNPQVPLKNPGIAYARAWAQHAPQQMFDWFQKRREFDAGHISFTGTLFSAWAEKDPGAALTAAAQCRSKHDHADALAAIVCALRKSDPARAAAVAAENISLMAIRSTTLFAASADIKQCREDWAFLTQMPPGKERGALLAKYFGGMFEAGIPMAAGFWNEIPEETRIEMMNGEDNGGITGNSVFAGEEAGVFSGLADLQRKYIEQTGDSRVAEQFLEFTAKEWARSDPDAAIPWTLEHLKGLQRTEAIGDLFKAAAQADYEAASRVWNSLPDGSLRARAAGNIAAGVPAEHQAAADALIASLSPSGRRIAESIRKDAEAAGDFPNIPIPPPP